MGIKLSCVDGEHIARWARGKRQGQPISAHTLGAWILKHELKATRASDGKRRTHRTNEQGKVEEVDTTAWEIDLDDLEQHPNVVIDRQRLADLEAERKRGIPDETARRVVVTEERMAAIEARLAEVEQEREDLATENNALRGRVTTLEEQIAGIFARLDEQKSPPAIHLREDSRENALRGTLEGQEGRSIFEPLPSVAASYTPSAAAPAHRRAAPLYGDAVSQVPAHRTHGEGRRASEGLGRWGDYIRQTDDPLLTPESGYLPFDQLRKAHGIKKTTADQHWKKYHAFVVQMMLIGKAHGYGINVENARIALRYWRDRGLLKWETIGHCGITNCPCPELLEG